MKTFMDNLKEVNEHIQFFKAGKFSYEKGLNEFSDLTNDEFHSHGYGSDDDGNSDDDQETHEVPHDAEIPESFDFSVLCIRRCSFH